MRQFERDGANAIYLMATAQYPFERFIDRAGAIRAAVDPATVLVANIADSSLEQYQAVRAAGFAGIYHAVRMGEGRDTPLDPARRRESMRLAKQAGLIVGTCVEPVGPEHTVEELVEKTLITREVGPCFSGAARRISIPGTRLAAHGMVSEARMAHILAVVRLALGEEIPGNCTHEPSIIGAAAGANLLWAEVGSNPRDTAADTKEARGMSVADCRRIFEEAECPVLDGPSRFFAAGRLPRFARIAASRNVFTKGGGMETHVFDRADTGDPVVSPAMYNFVIGLTLLWGFMVNWFMVQHIDPRAIAGVSPLMFFIGYFASCLLGIYLFNSSNNPAVSFLGYNLVVVPFGLVINMVVSQYDPALVVEAIRITGFVTAGMMVLGSLFPAFFQRIAGVLTLSLFIVIIVELVDIYIFHTHHGIIDWIVVLIFCGYIGYDWGRANRIPKTVDNAVDSAAAIYMDIINLFLRILRILGNSRR